MEATIAIIVILFFLLIFSGWLLSVILLFKVHSGQKNSKQILERLIGRVLSLEKSLNNLDISKREKKTISMK